MADYAQAYTGLSITVNGFGFLGSLTNFEPPEIKEHTEEYRGGNAAPVKMMVGYDCVLLWGGMWFLPCVRQQTKRGKKSRRNGMCMVASTL